MPLRSPYFACCLANRGRSKQASALEAEKHRSAARCQGSHSKASCSRGLSTTGVTLGLVGAWWLGRAASSLLFGVTASDPLTFTTVSLLLTAVALAACYFPARRAMRVDPIRALRVT